MSKTLVLDINELYRVVPETNVLEGKNFKDIGELLKNLITTLEKTGEWEFIQYVNNKPSLFVIREAKQAGPDITDTNSKIQNFDANLKKVSKTINALTKKVNSFKNGASQINPEELEIEEIEIETVASIYDDMDTDSTINAVAEAPILATKKLPWEE